MSKWQTPTHVVFGLMGGAQGVSQVCGLHRTAPYTWLKQGLRKEPGDIPSAALMRRLLAHARASGIPLTAEHLIFGAAEAELEALLARARPAAPPARVAAE